MKRAVLLLSLLGLACAMDEGDDGPAVVELVPCGATPDCPGEQMCGIDGVCESRMEPCRGLACGGHDRGACEEDQCACSLGFTNTVIDGYCCATEGPDPLCDVVEARPGRAGGLCLAPDGSCDDGFTCNQDQNFCFDPAAPCAGFYCGGGDRGACTVANAAPTCECNEGFENETFALYCCPTDGSDPLCT